MENEKNISAEPQAENFTVRFNHQDLELTPDEAVEFAQKGLKLESLQPVIPLQRQREILKLLMKQGSTSSLPLWQTPFRQRQASTVSSSALWTLPHTLPL